MNANENQPATQDKQNPVGSGSQKLSQLLDLIEQQELSALLGPKLVKANRSLLQFAQWMAQHPEFTKEAQRAINDALRHTRRPY